MRLDLVVATYRRPRLLASALESILAAPCPPGLHLRVVVVNNDPATDLSALVRRFASARVPVAFLEQPLPGKSRALNLAIATSSADFIGFIDDDELLTASWLQAAYDALRGGELDFIGGPMRPIWPSQPPDWVPDTYQAVLGIVDSGNARVRYSREFQGILVGGNAVIRRSLFDSIGPYRTDLGPQGSHRLLSCEDEDMYARLLEHGAHGEYLPELVVLHHVHPERIHRAYYRSWCFWNGASKAVLSRRRPMRLPGIAGIPRYVYGRAVRGAGAWFSAVIAGRESVALLEAELPMWQLAGHLYGRFRLRRLLPPSEGTGPRAPFASER